MPVGISEFTLEEWLAILFHIQSREFATKWSITFLHRVYLIELVEDEVQDEETNHTESAPDTSA